MQPRDFQYRLSSLHIAVACCALVLGAAQGPLARILVVVASLIFVVVMMVGALGVLTVFLLQGFGAAIRRALWFLRLPWLARRAIFERRLARVRPGHPSSQVRRLLGAPARIDGFGDVVYWSYRVAGERYTVSLDPRRLVAKYSGGLARDVAVRA